MSIISFVKEAGEKLFGGGKAKEAMAQAAAAPADDRLVIRDIWLLRLRALLARAHGDAGAYTYLWDRYREMAKTPGFEGHIDWAEAMIEGGE